MGNQSGSASGSAQSSSGGNKGAFMQLGSQLAQQGRDAQGASDNMLTMLAKMGPPPNIPVTGTASPQAGQAIVGAYQQRMAPPAYRSRLDHQLNPSVGAMLA